MAALPPDLAAFGPDPREKLRRAMILDLEEIGRPNKKHAGVARVRARAGCAMELARAGIAAWRRGEVSLADSWGEPPAPADPSRPTPSSGGALVDRVRSAQTHDERNEVLREIAARVLTEELTASQGREARALLAELRLSDQDKREIPVDDPERMYLLSQDGGLLVSAFERIVGDERRAAVLAFVREQLAADVAELPNVDPVGVL